MHRIPLTLTFIEPYRVIKWHKRKDRNSNRFLRGYSYARWHRSLKNDKGRPYITGTLVRSSIIKAAEELLWLHDGEYPKGTKCCPGQFKGSDAKIFHSKDFPELEAKRLRRRQTLTWDYDDSVCSENNPCPFCILLGRYEKSGQNSALNNVNFSNFNVLGKEEAFLNLGEIAERRIVNRVDQQSGKAEDFFNIWEIPADDAWNEFQGYIQVSDKVFNSGNFQAFLTLLEGASVLADKVSGALCHFTVERETEAGNEIKDEEAGENAKDLPDIVTPPYWDDMLSLAKTVSAAFEKEDKLVHLRLFSDVVRELRRSDVASLSLPKGHTDRLGKVADHFIWDIEIEKVKLRDWMPQQFEKSVKKYPTILSWRTFCEAFGQALYLEAKKKAPEQFTSQRPLGASPEMQVKAPEHQPGNSPRGFYYEWLITGELVSETPFFFGWSSQESEPEHTNLKILAAKDGHLRLPRSALRGILRRDLKIALDNKCRAELALRNPCSCPVCSLMKKISLRDSLSDYASPPEIRHRIRIDPKTGTVAGGALFDMETGPKGVKFDFELRFRSADDAIPQALETVLSWWEQGTAAFSGDAGTGKGRFCLKNLKYAQWDFKDEARFEDYKTTFGGRKEKIQELTEFKIPVENSYPWEVEEIKFSVCSPFLTKDPINSLIDPGGHDAICYKSWDNEKQKPVYLLKGESLRGILRTAVGRRENLLTKEHEDCSCTLCRIFGNEHEAGKIRVEDFIIQGDPESKVLDRVAIDRFTAGARDKFKFDTTPLIGTPEKPLIFRGLIWTHKDLDKDADEALKQALADIQNGLYPFGGLGNVGFGWVKSEFAYPHVLKSASFPIADDWNYKKPSPDKAKIYMPHYFLPFGKEVKRENTPPSEVKRENTPPSHACRKDEKEQLYSGKIVCTLETLTPLIVPDTSNPEKDENGHESYEFFSLNNGELCIPGSEIKGMIASVYESLTNSCLRIFDEKKRLSWRMEAKNLDRWKPGRIIERDGKLCVQEMEEMRLPVYDDPKLLKDIKNIGKKGYYRDKKIKNEKGKEVFKKGQPTRTDSLIGEHAEKIRKLLNKNSFLISDNKYRKWFKCAPHGMDNIALLEEPEKGYNSNKSYWINEGFIHFTGPNKLEKKKTDKPNEGGLKDDPLQIVHSEVALDKPMVNSSKLGLVERERAIPKYAAIEDGFVYTMTKRCERVFIPLKEKKSGKPLLLKKGNKMLFLSHRVKDKFHQLCLEYRQNAAKIPEVFRTHLPENDKLNPNALIYYFLDDEGEITDIIPVRISRTVDDNVLAEKLPDALRPCVREILNDETAKKIKKEGLKEVFQHHPEGLCPACSLFGTTFYKGRVSFGFAFPKNGTPELENEGRHITLPLLERPRPTWSMPRKADKVPGRKFYVHHQGWKDVMNNSDSEKPTPNNRSVKAVKEKNAFGFEIRFENLRDWGLGLLLYTLQLEPQFAHKLGMGKALGFGSVKIKAEAVHFLEKAIDEKAIGNALRCKLNDIWGKEINTLGTLFELLYYNEDKNIKVRYPKLEKENGINGYTDLVKEDGYKPENRRDKLITPWTEWA